MENGNTTNAEPESLFLASSYSPSFPSPIPSPFFTNFNIVSSQSLFLKFLFTHILLAKLLSRQSIKVSQLSWSVIWFINNKFRYSDTENYAALFEFPDYL